MKQPETLQERRTMSPADAACQLGIAITATAEYQAFNTTHRDFQNDSEAQELLRRFQDAQRGMHSTPHNGSMDPSSTPTLVEMQARVEQNKTLTKYFDAQEKLVALLTDLNEFMSEQLNMDFAGLTKPKSGCCG